MNWWTDPEVAWVWGPSFGIFFGKYEECSVRVWGCIQLHSFASPYGKWVNLSVTVLSHFQNTHKKRRREKKKQRSWWPPTVTFDLRISPEKFSTLSTRPATKPRFAGTLSRHLQQEDNTRDTRLNKYSHPWRFMVFRWECVLVFLSEHCEGEQPMSTENTERKSCWFKLEAVAAAGVHISQRNALIDWSVRSHSCLHICENAFLFVSTLSGNWFCLFLVFFFFGCQLGLSSDLHLIHKNAAASTAGNDVNKWMKVLSGCDSLVIAATC